MNKLLLTLGLLLSAPALADSIQVDNCVIRESIPGASATAAYFDIRYNRDDAKKFRLPGAEMMQRVEIPALSNRVEIHNVKMQDGAMKMFQIPRVMVTKPLTQLKPGAQHIMVMDLKQTIKAGEHYPMTIMFAYNPSLTCQATVKTLEQIQSQFGASNHPHKGH
ncbi:MULTISPECIES: copper chaperone PCu(A)C [Ferrimonas]|uniref:copper chaperone PCu(A)C n=1 Tax=Ferrimonas TaxID=44011 RepID=UPI0003FC9EC4|nr:MULTISPECIES: copper chaperone PCu(A)C [Ferrimonas]USD39366.1 copper chaperone PCu(A)C [Ferrimonas sp. SCSIO 43195]